MLRINCSLKCASLLMRRSFSQSNTDLSGHNKWSKIKQRKTLVDAQKGAIYGKISRDIVLAVRDGGSTDPALNLQLATVLRRAKEQCVPKDNIDRALAKAMIGNNKVGESITYEALAFNEVGLIIECLTDNANRTIHSIREILTTHGARFAPVKYMFRRKGLVKFALNAGAGSEEKSERIIDMALENGAEDFEQVWSNSRVTGIEFTCRPSSVAELTEALALPSLECKLLASRLIYTPAERSDVSGNIEDKISGLREELNDNEDTLQVWTSLDV